MLKLKHRGPIQARREACRSGACGVAICDGDGEADVLTGGREDPSDSAARTKRSSHFGVWRNGGAIEGNGLLFGNPVSERVMTLAASDRDRMGRRGEGDGSGGDKRQIVTSVHKMKGKKQK